MNWVDINIMAKWELDFVNNPCHYLQRLVAMISGYYIQEVIEVISKDDGWRAKDFIQTFNKLGYQCDERFNKFKPDVDSPVLLRAKIFNDPSHWFVCVYCQGRCYIPGDGIYSIEEFENKYHDLKITSMLRVFLN